MEQVASAQRLIRTSDCGFEVSSYSYPINGRPSAGTARAVGTIRNVAPGKAGAAGVSTEHRTFRHRRTFTGPPCTGFSNAITPSPFAPSESTAACTPGAGPASLIVAELQS